MIPYWLLGTILATLAAVAFGIAALFHVGWARWVATISFLLALVGWVAVIRVFKHLASM